MSNLTTWALRFAVAGALVAVAGPLAYKLRRLDLGAALLSVSVGGLLSLLVLGVLVVAIVKSGQLVLDRQAVVAAAIYPDAQHCIQGRGPCAGHRYTGRR